MTDKANGDGSVPGRPDRVPKLVVMTGATSGESYTITTEETVLGRSRLG